MSRLTHSQRNLLIASSVILLHVLGLWALQTGLLRRAAEVFVPAEIISEFLTPSPAKPAEPIPVHPQPRPIELKLATPEPLPAETAPAPNAPVVAPVAVTAAESVVAPTPVPAPPAPAKVELPSSDAQYLQNPKPVYPAISKRLNEQGKVVVRVLIGVDGTAQQAEIQQSSRYERLDEAALKAVLSWRYVPGKRGGVPEAMWFKVPIEFKLE